MKKYLFSSFATLILLCIPVLALGADYTAYGGDYESNQNGDRDGVFWLDNLDANDDARTFIVDYNTDRTQGDKIIAFDDSVVIPQRSASVAVWCLINDALAVASIVSYPGFLDIGSNTHFDTG